MIDWADVVISDVARRRRIEVDAQTEAFKRRLLGEDEVCEHGLRLENCFTCRWHDKPADARRYGGPGGGKSAR